MSPLVTTTTIHSCLSCSCCCCRYLSYYYNFDTLLCSSSFDVYDIHLHLYYQQNKREICSTFRISMSNCNIYTCARANTNVLPLFLNCCRWWFLSVLLSNRNWFCRKSLGHKAKAIGATFYSANISLFNRIDHRNSILYWTTLNQSMFTRELHRKSFHWRLAR